MSVNPGRLRDRITIQEGVIINTLGGATTTWSDGQSVWARVIQIGASGAARYEQAGYTRVTHEVIIRGGPIITMAGTRFAWGDRILQLAAPPVDTPNLGRFMTIACREVIDDG